MSEFGILKVFFQEFGMLAPSFYSPSIIVKKMVAAAKVH